YGSCSATSTAVPPLLSPIPVPSVVLKSYEERGRNALRPQNPLTEGAHACPCRLSACRSDGTGQAQPGRKVRPTRSMGVQADPPEPAVGSAHHRALGRSE